MTRGYLEDSRRLHFDIDCFDLLAKSPLYDVLYGRNIRNSNQLLMHLLQGIHSLFELNIIGRKFCLTLVNPWCLGALWHGSLPSLRLDQIAPWRNGLFSVQTERQYCWMRCCISCQYKRARLPHAAVRVLDNADKCFEDRERRVEAYLMFLPKAENLSIVKMISSLFLYWKESSISTTRCKRGRVRVGLTVKHGVKDDKGEPAGQHCRRRSVSTCHHNAGSCQGWVSAGCSGKAPSPSWGSCLCFGRWTGSNHHRNYSFKSQP